MHGDRKLAVRCNCETNRYRYLGAGSVRVPITSGSGGPLKETCVGSGPVRNDTVHPHGHAFIVLVACCSIHRFCELMMLAIGKHVSNVRAQYYYHSFNFFLIIRPILLFVLRYSFGFHFVNLRCVTVLLSETNKINYQQSRPLELASCVRVRMHR